jgi:hypothetical protein
MYPGDQLGGGYTEADLPDSITITIDGVGGDTRTATKSGSEYVYGSYGAIPNLKLGVVDDAWQFIPNADNLSGYVQTCLFDTLGGTTEAEFTIEDNFADNYTADWGFTTREPERTSLCTWFDGSFVLVYTTPESIDAFDGEYTGPLYKWVAEGRFLQPDEGGGFWVKDDPQNSPEGTYQGISGQTLGFETFTIPEP